MSPRERVQRAGQMVAASSLWTWQTVTIAWRWLLAPLVSHWQGLSLTRFLAVGIAVMVGHEVFVHEKALTWVDFWMMLAAIATAFGKPVFAILLSRVGLKSSSLDTTEKVDITTRQIQARRAQGREWDAEPTA